MKVAGVRTFAAPRELVWEVLNDPSRMAKLMPGVESFDVQDERHWSAKVKVPLGLGALPLSFGFEKMDEREPEYAKLSAKGNGVGAIVQMETEFHLSEQGGGKVDERHAARQVGRPLRQVGDLRADVGSVVPPPREGVPGREQGE